MFTWKMAIKKERERDREVNFSRDELQVMSGSRKGLPKKNVWELLAECCSCRPTNSVKALKEK